MGHSISVILSAQRLGTIFGFPITNAIVMTWLVIVLLVIFAFLFGRSLRMVPGKFQAGVEWLFSVVYDYMAETLESDRLAKRFFPLIMTIFLFVLVGNELEFFPGVGSIGVFHGATLLPFLRTPATDLNFTLALAAISFFTVEITGLSMLGFLKYVRRFVNLRSPIEFAVGLIELVSNLARLISFSFRLFGNIFAGEVMVLVALAFAPYFLPVPLMAFETFVGFIQAFVFAILTLFFIKLAIAEPHAAT